MKKINRFLMIYMVAVSYTHLEQERISKIIVALKKILDEKE